MPALYVVVARTSLSNGKHRSVPGTYRLLQDHRQTTFGHPFSCEFIGQLLNGLFCMTVYRSVGDHDSVILRCVGRPGIIEADIMSKIFFGKTGPWSGQMVWTIQSCGYFQKVLHLHTIFSNDADIVSFLPHRPMVPSASRAPNFPKPSAEKRTFLCCHR